MNGSKEEYSDDEADDTSPLPLALTGSLFIRRIKQPSFASLAKDFIAIEVRLLVSVMAIMRRPDDADFTGALFKENLRALEVNCRGWHAAMDTFGAGAGAKLWCDTTVIDAIAVNRPGRARQEKRLLVYRGRRLDKGGLLLRHVVTALNAAYVDYLQKTDEEAGVPGSLERYTPDKLLYRAALYEERDVLTSIWSRFGSKEDDSETLRRTWGDHIGHHVALGPMVVAGAWDRFEVIRSNADITAAKFGQLLDKKYH